MDSTGTVVVAGPAAVTPAAGAPRSAAAEAQARQARAEAALAKEVRESALLLGFVLAVVGLVTGVASLDLLLG